MSALLPLEAIEMNLCAEYGYSSRTFQKFPNVPQSNDYRSCLFLVYTQANAINNRIPKYRNHFTLFRNEDTLIICRTETTIRYEDNDAVITYEIIKPLDEIDQRYRSTYNNWIVSFDKITYSSLFPSLIGFTLVCSGEWWFFDRGIILNGKTSYVANEDVESMFIYYEKHVNYTLTMPSNDTLLSMPPIFSAKSARTINNLVPVNETTEPMSIIQNINETNLLASSQQKQQQQQQIHSKQQQQQQQQQQDEPNQQIIQNNQSQQQFRARPLPQPQSQQQSAELYASLLNQLSNIANSTTVPQAATTTSNASTSGLFNPEPPSVDIFTPQLPRNLQNSTLLLEQTQEISTSNIPAPESQTSQLLSSSTNTQLSAPPQPPTPILGIQSAESTNQSQSTLTTNIQYQQQQQQQQPQPQPQLQPQQHQQQQQYPLNNNTTTRLNNSIAQFTMSTLPSGILPYMNGVARPTIQENDTTTPPIVETTAVIPALHWFDERSNELYRGNIEYFRPIDYNGCRRVSKVLARKF